MVAKRMGRATPRSISADGNVVTFRSLADNLVQDDRNDSSDIFVHDRRTRSVRRVSVNLDRDEGNEDSLHRRSVAMDGSSFESTASNLVPGDTNAAADIFVADLFTGVIERVSVSSEGIQGDRDSYEPSISHDGRYVAFTSASRALTRQIVTAIWMYTFMIAHGTQSHGSVATFPARAETATASRRRSAVTAARSCSLRQQATCFPETSTDISICSSPISAVAVCDESHTGTAPARMRV